MKVFALLLAVLVAAQAYTIPVPENKLSYDVPNLDAAPAKTTDVVVAPSNKDAAAEDVPSMPMPYAFSYNVADQKSLNEYEETVNSDGTTVTGSYRVLLPDTRTQIVTYTSGPDGYVAQVSYIGEAAFPDVSKTK